MQGDGGQRNGLLLAGGQQHVEFALAGMLVDRFGPGDELVGDARARGNNHDQLVAFVAGGFDAFGNPLDALDVSHRGAAVFLDDSSHIERSENAAKERARLGDRPR